MVTQFARDAITCRCRRCVAPLPRFFFRVLVFIEKLDSSPPGTPSNGSGGGAHANGAAVTGLTSTPLGLGDGPASQVSVFIYFAFFRCPRSAELHIKASGGVLGALSTILHYE